MMSRHLVRRNYYPSTPHTSQIQTPPPTRNCIISLSFIPQPHHFTLSHHPTSYKARGSSNGIGTYGGGGGGGGGGDNDGGSSAGDDNNKPSSVGLGIIGLFVQGWRSRVAADPQLPFKVLMEELVGVTACCLGDMASRPNFGLNELDFVFSTLIVGAIVNVVLMYVLAPTTAATTTATAMSSIFSTCPKGHMFESGCYTVLQRLGTLVYKGVIFSGVGFGAGLLGTVISNGLIAARKKMDPEFETPNKPPPTVLNALTWAAHLGLSCNLRYQSLTGLEFVLAEGLPPMGFKACVIGLRCLNNILGGVSFVMMARITGSQKAAGDESCLQS